MTVTAKITSSQLRETAQDTLAQLNTLQGMFAVLSEQLLAYPSQQKEASDCFHTLGVYKKGIADFCDTLVVLLEIVEEQEKHK